MPLERLKWTPELVNRFWDGISQSRLVEFNFAKQGGRSLVIAVDHLLPPDGRVLDFGAGDGELIRLMCDRGFRAAAYEPAKERSDKLQTRLRDREGFLGVIGNDSTETFDVVIMAEVIEHILEEQLDETLGRISSLTKPGGLLVVTTPNNEDLDLSMTYCPVSNHLFHRWQHVRSFTRETLCGLLQRFGFEEMVTHQLAFDDNVFVPLDKIWGRPDPEKALPDYIVALRENQPVRIGSESNLLYIGRKRAGAT